MKEPTHLTETMGRNTKSTHSKPLIYDQISSYKLIIQNIRTNHERKLHASQREIQDKHLKSNDKKFHQHENLLQRLTLEIIKNPPSVSKNENVSETDKMLYQKKFKNFLNHRQEFQALAKQRREKIIEERKKKQGGDLLNESDIENEYVDREQIMKDTSGENQFQNAEQMMGFYEEITFGKKNKKNGVKLYHGELIEERFRKSQFDHLIQIETGQNEKDHNGQIHDVAVSIKKDTLLNYLFDEPAVMMLYSINPYQLGDELAEFQTQNPEFMTFEDFSKFLHADREPTYFQYSQENLQEARKIGRGIKCQPIIPKWIADSQIYDWLIELYKSVDILGEQKTDKEILVKKITKQALKKRLLDQEIIEIVNINKLITLDRILYQIQHSSSETNQITLEQFDSMLRNYHRLKTQDKDKLTTKLILAGKYDPSYVFILGNEPLDIIKQTFNSMQKFAEYFVPKQKFVQKFVKNPKYSKIRNLVVRSQSNRYVKKQTIQQTLVRFLNQAESCVDIEQILDFFTNRGRPRNIEHQIYLANLQAQIQRIQEEQSRKQQIKLSEGDYSTSSDQEEFQKMIKQKTIQRKKQKLASIRAADQFAQGKRFNVTVPNTFSFGTGVKQKTKISIRQKKLKEQLDEKRRKQNQSMQPIKPKPVPQHVKEDLYEKITKDQERQRKQRLERFRLESQQNMYPISPHLLSKPKSKSIYERETGEYKFVAKPLPWYCEVNLLERIQKQKDERRERILEQVINKHNDIDIPEGVKKMLERGQTAQQNKQRLRAMSKTTANDKQCTFNPKITQGIPNFQMIHEHLRIDLDNKKQQKQPIQVVPFSFQNRPTRSRTAIQPQQRKTVQRHRESEVKKEQEQINIPITEKHLALVNLRKKQEQEKIHKLEEEKRASTVRKMRQQKFAPYVRQVLKKSRVGDVANSRAVIESKIKEFKKQERKRKRQYEEQMIKIYTKVFNRPLLVEGEGQQVNTFQDQNQHHHPHENQRSNQREQQKRKQKPRQDIEHFAEDYDMPNPPESQYSKRNPKQDHYDDLRRKAIEHPPRNYLMEEPNDDQNGENHDQQYDQEGQYLSENGRYTN